MRCLSTLAYRAYKLARYLERPGLFALRQRGVVVDDYLKLTQPWLRTLAVRTVLDIGANTGQFAALAQAAFPEAQIYSFEPLPECFQRLQANLANAGRFRAFNVGLGREAGTLTFQRNAFTASSSFRRMTDTHKREFPLTKQTTDVRVRVERLDDLAPQLALREPLFVKIDVQGYEDEVLAGGEQTIRRAALVLAETSFETLYEGQPLFNDIHRTLVGWGFTYAGSLDQIYSPHDGRPLQADSLFIRREESGRARVAQGNIKQILHY